VVTREALGQAGGHWLSAFDACDIFRCGGAGAVTIEVQCTSCHTKYRIDEQVLPEGTPTFKCSRCGHVFTLEPRSANPSGAGAATATSAARAPRARREGRQADPEALGEKSVAGAQSVWVADSGTVSSKPAESATDDAIARHRSESPTPAAAAPPASSGEPRPSTGDLLSKPFRDEESTPGENLRFDFSEEQSNREQAEREAAAPVADEIAQARERVEWQVGETEFEGPDTAQRFEAVPTSRTEPAVADEPAPAPRVRKAAAAKRPKAESEEFLDEDAAPIYNHGIATHSARFFVALFALIGLGYGVMTVLIRSAPATAAEMLSEIPKIGDRFILPIAPARLVAMRDVHADYLRTKGGHTALVVTGVAENVGGKSLHTVQIAANLHDARQHLLASRAVYCGNNLSAPMVAQMTPHELEFFQKLDPPKTFALEPSATAPFVIVFIDPPSSVNGFEVSVANALADENAPPPAPDSGG
jgi:predicted Zn finger-like uncharacterized protein